MRALICVLFALASSLFGAELYDFDLCAPAFSSWDNKRSEGGVLSVGGSASVRGALQFDDRNAPDRFRELQLRGSFEARCVNENGFFKITADAVRENAKDAAARSDAELSEAYFQARLGAADIKLGRQIVAWGKSDLLRVTDALNPLDSQEPGMSDVGDLRLGVAMARLDYYIDDWNLQAIAIPEARYSKRPHYPSEFMPYDVGDTHKPKSTQGALAAIGVFESWDISFYAASLHLDEFRNHAKAAMFGAAAAIAIDDFLIKGETAVWRANGGDYMRFDMLAGADYSGVRDTTITVEAMFRHTKNDRVDLLMASAGSQSDYEESLAARIQRDLLNASLRLSATTTIGLSDDKGGGALRIQGDYEIANNYLLTAGFIAYFGDLEPYKSFDRNDRVFTRMKVSF
ncbi:MAG: hypothetical protein LBC09_00505 [Helicobacteraceae bacterium]|jgi:hypothetical protein|nr:hypothetical protein [Helicobacteraceae bacterium]